MNVFMSKCCSHMDENLNENSCIAQFQRARDGSVMNIAKGFNETYLNTFFTKQQLTNKKKQKHSSKII